MTTSPWTTEPYSVRVGLTRADADRLAGQARAAGVSVIALDLAGVQDREGLADRLAATFLYPYPTRGLDAAVDLISDLEWFASAAGYCVLIDGADSCPAAPIEALASILPAIVDRWRSQQTSFVAVFVGRLHAAAIEAGLGAANDQLLAAGRHRWVQVGTEPVPVLLARPASDSE